MVDPVISLVNALNLAEINPDTNLILAGEDGEEECELATHVAESVICPGIVAEIKSVSIVVR